MIIIYNDAKNLLRKDQLHTVDIARRQIKMKRCLR